MIISRFRGKSRCFAMRPGAVHAGLGQWQGWSVIAVLCIAVLTACGSADDAETPRDGTASTSAAKRAAPERRSATGIAGVWEMRYRDAAGQLYVNVLELRDDGTYASFMADRTPDDQGRYRYADGALKLESDVQARLSGVFPARLDGSRLTLTLPALPPTRQGTEVVWQRSELTPAFDTTQVMGRPVPRELTRFVREAMVGVGLTWQGDALPIGLEVGYGLKGQAEVRLVLYSPASEREMMLTVTRYRVRSRDYAAQPRRRLPLPEQFVELTDVLSRARQQGLQGEFSRASLRTYDPAGPAWMLSSAGPVGATYSALNGERINGDVTGYVAAYEQQATQAVQAWRRLLAGAPTTKERQREACREIVAKSTCEDVGCSWSGMGLDTGFNLCVPSHFMLLD